MNLSLINAMFAGNFFNVYSKYKNHKLVNVISVNEETKMALVVLQRYYIGAGASVSTNGKSLINVEIPYDEFKKVNR
jgi:hypothetical protein